MPRAWSPKDERQYRHVRDGSLARKVTLRRAKQIAARTVNKQRRLEGRTSSSTTQGTGNPNLPLEERTRQELYNLAREIGIGGRSGMSKTELARAIRGGR